MCGWSGKSKGEWGRWGQRVGKGGPGRALAVRRTLDLLLSEMGRQSVAMSREHGGSRAKIERP